MMINFVSIGSPSTALKCLFLGRGCQDAADGFMKWITDTQFYWSGQGALSINLKAISAVLPKFKVNLSFKNSVLKTTEGIYWRTVMNNPFIKYLDKICENAIKPLFGNCPDGDFEVAVWVTKNKVGFLLDLELFEMQCEY